MAATLTTVMAVSAASANRILIDDPGQTVTVSNNFSCYSPVDITVDTANPQLYEADSATLQKLSDSVRAMLSYECPGLSAIRLTGLIRGLDEIVYQGEILKSNDWLITPVHREKKQNLADRTSPLSLNQSATAKRYDDELKPGDLEVIGLHLGMSVDEVSERVSETFGVAPQYDAEKGLLTMHNGDCPVATGPAAWDTEPGTQLVCLEAWFSDNRIARLQRLSLLQIVDASFEQVNGLLIEKYGNPTKSNTAADNVEMQMVWRAINSGSEDQSVIQEIDALIKRLDNDLVSTNVSLYSTEQAVVNPQGYADLDLKL